MRGIIHNRWVVGGLLIGALSVWLLPADLNLAKGARHVPPATASPPMGAAAETNTTATAQPAGTWRTWAREATSDAAAAGLRRDPFSYHSLSTPAVVTAPPKSPPPPDLVLRGVSIHDGRAFAVVNRRVVKEGETIGEWRVARIETESVWIDGPAGQFVLRFRSPPEPRTPGALALEAVTTAPPLLPLHARRTTE